MEINNELIEEIFKMANMEVPKDPTEIELVSAIQAINNNKDSQKASGAKSENAQANSEEPATNNALVIDDIGVVTYQLKILMQNFGYNVQTAKDIFAALNIFSKNNFDIIVMDLFVSTEQEGYTLLTEIKKIMAQRKTNTKIIVITASNKSENKIKCLNLGADAFLKKDVGWQDELAKIIEKYQEENL